MGVEYKHFLIPVNPSFVPAKDVLKKLDEVLSKWNLKSGNPKIFNLTNGSNTVVTEPLEELNFGHGLALVYPEIMGRAAAKIMGESFYQEIDSDDDRYIHSLTFIVGTDFRIHPSNEEINVTILKAPLEDSIPVKPISENSKPARYGWDDEAFSCSLSATPPEVEVWVSEKERIIGKQKFAGYWRTALIIDCGKDLPKLSDVLYKIPNKEFIVDFENALGCAVIEIGEVC